MEKSPEKSSEKNSERSSERSSEGDSKKGSEKKERILSSPFAPELRGVHWTWFLRSTADGATPQCSANSVSAPWENAALAVAIPKPSMRIAFAMGLRYERRPADVNAVSRIAMGKGKQNLEGVERMRIDSLEIFLLGIPWKTERRSEGSEGNEPDTGRLETVLVRLESGGVSGWGEASPGRTPCTTSEWAGGVFACAAEYLGPTIVGRSFTNSEDLAKTFARVHGNAYAKAAFDLAWWDCLAKQKKVPLPTLLGTVRQTLTLGAVFDQVPDSSYQRAMDVHIARIEAAVAAGYSRLGLKIRPGWDVQMVSSVRREFGSMLIHGDLEGALSMGYSELLYRFDDFFMKMLEQPLAASDLVSSAMLQNNIRTRICLDESIQSVLDAQIAVDLRSGRCINLKPQRVGGLTPALEILKHAESHQTDCWVGATPSTAIGARFNLTLAAKTAWDYPTDDFDGESLLETDVAAGPERFRDETREGSPLCAKLWTEPGIGIEPDPDILQRYTIHHVTLPA